MPKALYQWQGINQQGTLLRGTMVADSVDCAKDTHRKQDVIVRSIKKNRQTFIKNFKQKIKPSHVLSFLNQLLTLLKAGLSLATALDLAHSTQTNANMAVLILTLKQAVENGSTFSESLQQYPGLFNEVFICFIRVGETTGMFEVMLERTIYHCEKTMALKRKIIKAFTYPLLVLFFSGVIAFLLLEFIVPQFQLLFANFNAELPWLTRSVVHLATIVQRYWLLLILGCGGSIAMLFFLYKKSGHFARKLEWVMHRTPILGGFLKKGIVVRFAQTFALSYAAGVSLVEGMDLIASTVASVTYRAAVYHMKQDLINGYTIHATFKNSGLFPPAALEMVYIGEQSGALERMLQNIAVLYEAEMDRAFDIFSALLEPLLMIILGVIVGTLVLAMYLPVLKLGTF